MPVNGVAKDILGNFRVDMLTSAGERWRRYSGESLDLTRREVDNVTESLGS
jgi:hypothetical protein